MPEMNPHSTARVAGHPLHPMIIPFPIAFFISAFVTDLVFLSGGRPGFAEASMWLLGAGIAMALLAAVFGFIDFFGDRQVRGLRHAWWHMGLNLLAVVLEAVNLYLRSANGAAASVAGTGVILSGVVVLLLLVTGWLGGDLVFRHHVGVSEIAEP